MAYGLIYQGALKSTMVDRPYTVQILQKDYAGSFSTIILGALPIVNNYQTDDIRSPVRGGSATLNIINTGSLPITTFYSIADDQFQVIILQGSDVLFIGFVVQDDSSELMVDFTHEITLQCNDNLGLLKDVAFNFDNTVITDFYARNSLASIIHQCLHNTGLELETYVYVNLWEDRMVETDSCFPQAFVDCNMFINGSTTDTNGKSTDTFMSCYDVLNRILDRFNCSLFQAYGRWNIVRWDELRGLTTIHAFVYDKNWLLFDSKLLPFAFTADPNIGAGAAVPDMFPETGLTRQIFRPFLFDRETFNYVQPKYLLKNYDLQTLGALIRSYVDSGNTVNEYVATDWGAEWPTSDSPRAIQGVPFEVTKGDKIKVSFAVSTNFTSGIPSPGTIVFATRLFDGVSNRYIDDIETYPGSGERNWKPDVGYNYLIAAGDNLLQWHTVSMQSSQIPFDGLLFVYLAGVGSVTAPYERFIRVVVDSIGNEVTRYLVGRNTSNPSHETRYQDIRVEYTQFINDSTKITGHVHKDIQTDAIAQKIKNNEDVQIYLDDSPSNQAVGTLFLSTFHGLVQDRTSRWHRAGFTESKRLGEIMTTETLQWRSLPRTKLEGTFYGLVQNAMHLALLIPLKFSYLNPLRFVFGQMEIDFRNNCVKCTAWELTGQAGEFNVNQLYSFTYIYSTK